MSAFSERARARSFSAAKRASALTTVAQCARRWLGSWGTAGSARCCERAHWTPKMER